MRVLGSLLLFILILCGCATTSPSCNLPKAQEGDATTLVIYRPSAFFAALYSTPFSIDGCAIKSLANNSYMVYKLPAGHHRIAAEKWAMAVGGEGVVEGDFEAGKIYYLHYSMSPENIHFVPVAIPGGGVMGFTTSTHFFITTEEQAFQIMPKLRAPNKTE